jgi:hypothetical protein
MDPEAQATCARIDGIVREAQVEKVQAKCAERERRMK